MFVDSHAHLTSGDFEADLSSVVQRARDAQVERVLVIGSGAGAENLGGAIRLAERFAALDAAIGIHPHEASLATEEDFQLLLELSRQPRIIAWGEIGLDFHYDHSPRDVQTRVFARQLELAEQRALPVIIHTREAETETLEILKEHQSGLRGILHCYSGTWNFAKACLEMDFLVSFSGMLTFPKAQNVRDVASKVPLDRLLIETDAPYLAPVPHRGERNEPALVVETAKALALLKGVSLEEIANMTTENYQRFFQLTCASS